MLQAQVSETQSRTPLPPPRRVNGHQHRRIAVTGSATMYLVRGAGELKILTAEMRHASADGIGVHLQVHLRTGQLVLMEFSSSFSLWGRVRRSNPNGNGYQAVVAIIAEDDSRLDGLAVLAQKLGYADTL